jgi:hypothetical protein
MKPGISIIAALLACAVATAAWAAPASAAPKSALPEAEPFRPKPTVPIGIRQRADGPAVPGLPYAFDLEIRLGAGLNNASVTLAAGDGLLLNGPGSLVTLAVDSVAADIAVIVTPLAAGTHYLTVTVSAFSGAAPLGRSLMIPVRAVVPVAGAELPRAVKDLPRPQSDTGPGPVRGGSERIRSLPAVESTQ